ncbi:MAG: insulinase family protein [Proteobacteria bacterium]|nr:insulinase family protein [Pseudomonadota bacterium]
MSLIPRRLPLAVFLAIQMLMPAAEAAGKTEVAVPTPEAEAGGFASYRLANGFKIVLAPFPSAASVRVELLVKTGSKQEGYGETGMAHLLEHMLFKSAGPRADLKRDLTALGATWNGTTTTDRTNYFEVVAAEPEKVDEVLRLEADRFIRASFTKAHLASEMTVVRNELERNDTDPGSVVMRALQRQSYFWHGYGRPTIGARSDIEDAPFEALQAFHDKYYRPDNAALIVSGRFDTQRVLALASRLFAEARNPAGPKPTTWTREEPRAVINRSELFLPAGTTIAASGWKLPGMRDRSVYAFDLGVSAICAQDWGSLRKDLVLERKLAVSAQCRTQIQPDYSLLVGSASAGKDADAEALGRALREHLETAARQGITSEQLERARQAELNGYERLASNHESVASLLSRAEVAGDWRLFFWQRDMAREVTLDEVNAALRKWVVPTNRADVLLRHGDQPEVPAWTVAPTAQALVANGNWPVLAQASDPIPASAAELAKASVAVALPSETAKAVLIPRKTQGALAWISLNNDYGNTQAFTGRRVACNFGSSLLAYGGAGLDRDQLDARLEALQAQWSLSLGEITLEVPRKNADAALDILLAVWAKPSLPQNEFERMKAASIARLEAALKDPASVASSQAALRFDNYPDEHPNQPWSLERQLAAVRAATYEQACQCVADLHGIGRLRLAAVGDFTPADVQGVWNKLAQLPKSPVPYERIREEAAPAEVDTAPIVVSMPAKPNASVVGQALLPITDDSPDFPALRIAAKVLGGDADSRIWQRLREKEGLAYGAGVSLAGRSFDPRSSFRLQASAASPQAEAALVSLKAELARALKDGFSEQEVERAKRTWLEERKTGLRNEKGFVGVLSAGLENGHDYAWIAQYDAQIARLSAADVTAVFRKYLQGAPLVWSVGRGE